MANPNWLPGKQQHRALPQPRKQNVSKAVKYRRTLKPLNELIDEVQNRFGRVCDPATILLMVSAGLDPLYPDIVPDDPANPPPGYAVPDLETRIDAAKAIINYVRPKLAQVEHVGDEDRPVHFDTKMSEAISVDLQFRELAERLIIGMAGNPTLLSETGPTLDITATPYDDLDDEEEVSLIDPDKGLIKPLPKDDE